MTDAGDGERGAQQLGGDLRGRAVDVEGKQAVWIFTEFETGESLKTLRDWLIPDHWPEWGGEMFKEMRPIGSVDLRPTQDTGQADPFELPRGRRDRRPPARDRAALRVQVDRGVGGHRRYDLDRSVGDMLQVDRGYLMAADVGGRRHVKALKVVGFTDTLLNNVATTGLSRVEPLGPARHQGGRGPGRRRQRQTRSPARSATRTPGSRGPTEGAAAFTGGVAEQWISTVTDMVDFYAPFTTDVSERVWSGNVRPGGLRERHRAASSSASPATGRSPGRRGWRACPTGPTSPCDRRPAPIRDGAPAPPSTRR